jgi:hypothetical protein
MSRRHRDRSAGLLAAVFALWFMLVTAAPAAGDDDARPRRITAAGDRQQIGTALGTKLKASLHKRHPQFLTIAVGLAGQTKDKLYRRAAAIGRHLADEDIDELKAMAAASGLSYDDVLFLNCFYTLTTRHTLACRQLAAWGEKTRNGNLLHTRNLDWIDYPGRPLHAEHLIVNVDPTRGHRHLLLAWPGLNGALTGTNDKGITVAYNQFPGGNRKDRLAEPVFFTLRRVLRTCADLESAVKLIRRARPIDDGSILISDARAKRAAVVELIDGRVGVRKPADGEPMIGNANHCTRETNVRGDSFVPVYRATWPTVDVARRTPGKLDAAAARRIMAHRRVLQPINILSVVFEPGANRMQLSLATRNAARRPFVEYELFPETPEADASRADH